MHGEKIFCLHCRRHIVPRSSIKESNLPFKFHYPLVGVHALCNYHQNSLQQRLMHEIKYEHRPEIAFELGIVLSSYVIRAEAGSLVPVPQTWYKLHRRGYNQSEVIARGISSIWSLPVYDNLLKRTRHKYSQTKMNRLQRHENLSASLQLNMNQKVEQPVWLVDDVVTTGATLNACLEILFQAGYNRVGILVLADA